jgi:hypothetical protein
LNLSLSQRISHGVSGGITCHESSAGKCFICAGRGEIWQNAHMRTVQQLVDS